MGYLLAIGILLSTAIPFIQTQTNIISQQNNEKIMMASSQANLGETPSFISEIMNSNSNSNNGILIVPSIMKHRNSWWENSWWENSWWN